MGQIVFVLAVLVGLGIVVTNPNGDSAVLNSIFTGTQGTIKALEVKNG